MLVSEMQAKIAVAKAKIAAELPTADAEERKNAEFVMIGLDLLGEFFVDLKRIADAAEALEISVREINIS
jgi:hypothetical protein